MNRHDQATNHDTQSHRGSVANLVLAAGALLIALWLLGFAAVLASGVAIDDPERPNGGTFDGLAAAVLVITALVAGAAAFRLAGTTQWAPTWFHAWAAAAYIAVLGAVVGAFGLYAIFHEGWVFFYALLAVTGFGLTILGGARSRVLRRVDDGAR